MGISSLLLALAFQVAAPADPHALSEWELLTLASIWGPAGEPWKEVPMWAGVTGGTTISGPYWSAPHLPAAPIELRDWSVPADDSPGDAAAVLAPWFLDPDAPVVMPPEPNPRQPKNVEPAAKASWTDLAPLGERRPVVAFTTFASPREEVRVARVSGARWFLWNGEPFVADGENRGFEGVPVRVRPGTNRVFVAVDGAHFEFALHEPRSTVYVDRFDIVWPGGKDPMGDELGLNVFNASMQTVRGVCTHYGHLSGWSATCAPRLTDWRDGGYFAPLCMQRRATYYSGFVDNECPLASGVDHGCEYNAISVFTSDGSPAERLLLRRGSAWETRHANNTQSVARPARGEVLGFADLFAADAVHVYASLAREETTLARARLLQQSAWYHRGDVPLVARDVDARRALTDEKDPLSWFLRNKQLVLHGNATTNTAWPKDLPDGAPLKVVDGRVEIEGRVHEGDDIAGFHASDKDGTAGPRAVFDTGEKGARLASLLATTWSGPRERWAVFRVDARDPRGWSQIDGAARR